MKKRSYMFSALVLAIVLVASALAGCSSSSTTESTATESATVDATDSKTDTTESAAAESLSSDPAAEESTSTEPEAALETGEYLYGYTSMSFADFWYGELTNPMDTVSSGECFRCMRCAHACPQRKPTLYFFNRRLPLLPSCFAIVLLLLSTLQYLGLTRF